MVPVQLANSAKARLPAVSRPVTRRPEVRSGFQRAPPVWVTQSPGPNAQPSWRSRKRSWLTPVPPDGGPVCGALTPYQVAP